jgi:hypothetical protein
MVVRNHQPDEHDAFAESRSSNFVYIMNKTEASEHPDYDILEEHCETSNMEQRLPLIVCGDPGSGKSALLANWVKQRQENPHNKHEFLFQYFVDCSSESLQLRRMLFRLISAIKDHFNLREMEVPVSEERLRWGLIRFIEAAAKKYQNTQSARMIIVLDGVNRLQSPGSLDGTLKWLPTSLPASVRFVVSTVERVPGTWVMHRSFQELKRRQCPILKIQGLTKDACIGIMKRYAEIHYPALKLDQDQQARVMDAPASSQPLFLRALLDSLRIGVELFKTSLEDQLERSLSKETPEELISFLLGQWTAIFDSESAGDSSQGILCWVLSLLYVSRHGLSDAEMQGAVTLAMGKPLSDDHRRAIMELLKDMTMMVDGIRRFSNDALKQAIWEMYVKTPHQRLRLHTLLGKYFMKLKPCHRKLEELPYHLEISGHWTKLKHALVAIDMFKWWWTPAHKEEFIKLWASLTAHPSNRRDNDGYVTNNLEPKDYPVPTSRPCYDVVEEYTKSVDEFIGKFGKPEEEVSHVVLRIADFLLEFATSGHEVDADVPMFSRPEVLTTDLGSLGVPYLNTDENGRSCLNTPVQKSAVEVEGGDAQAARTPAASDGLPICSTYFYRRWMWIQFPLVALANCGEKFKKGINRKNDTTTPGFEETATDLSKAKQADPMGEEEEEEYEEEEENTMSLSSKTILPRLPGPKAAASISLLAGQDDDRHMAYAAKVSLLRRHVANYRTEADMLSRQRNILKQQMDRLMDECDDLDKLEQSVSDGAGYLGRLNNKNDKMNNQQANADLLSRNYRCVLLMCERHPPRSDVLVEDLENQMKQDEVIIDAVQKRLRTAMFESSRTEASAQELLDAMEENSRIQHEILENLHTQREQLWNEKENVKQRMKKRQLIEKDVAGDMGKGQEARLQKKDVSVSMKQVHREQQNRKMSDSMAKWDKLWKTINERTGIADPQVFFEKFHNRDTLEVQMEEMKLASENKLTDLKKQHQDAEADLEDVRYGAFAMNGSSKELRDKDDEVTKAAVTLKRSREKFTGIESLLHSVTAGVTHIGEIIGIQKAKGQQQSTQEILELLEQLLTELLDEDDESASHAQPGKGAGPNDPSSHTSDQPLFENSINVKSKRKGGALGDELSDEEPEDDIQMDPNPVVPDRDALKDMCRSLTREHARLEKRNAKQGGVLEAQ